MFGSSCTFCNYSLFFFVCVLSNDTRPGLVSSQTAKKYQKEVKHKTTNAIDRQQNKPRQTLESEQREEGLKNALTADNKGFKLLAKMGYKPGTAIGKSGKVLM